METPLKMMLQVLSLVAKELALIHDDTDLIWDPPGGAPQLTLLGVSYGSVKHQNRRGLSDGLAGRQGLIALAPVTPALGCCLALGAGLENLGEGGLGILLISGENLGLDPLASIHPNLETSRIITMGG